MLEADRPTGRPAEAQRYGLIGRRKTPHTLEESGRRLLQSFGRERADGKAARTWPPGDRNEIDKPVDGEGDPTTGAGEKPASVGYVVDGERFVVLDHAYRIGAPRIVNHRGELSRRCGRRFQLDHRGDAMPTLPERVHVVHSVPST
jgi:hypothetical protein